MIPERFTEIVDAYGADPQRWPEAERAEALAFASAHPDAAGPILASAALLDRQLSLYTTEPAGARLERLILESAPRRIASRGRTWWSRGMWHGAGFAAAGLAGVVVGAIVMTQIQLPGGDHGDDIYAMTAFGDPVDLGEQ